jgi:hypothetical protein
VHLENMMDLKINIMLEDAPMVFIFHVLETLEMTIKK